MRWAWRVAGAVVGLALVPIWAAGSDGDVSTLAERYCGRCHDAEEPAAGLVLTNLGGLGERAALQRAATAIEAGQMPPAGARPLRGEDRERLLAWLHRRIAELGEPARDVGRVTMRRLNRYEYDNTIRDLLGLRTRPAEAFPFDDVGYGFDNNGDVLGLPTILMEKYLAAAEAIAEQVIDARDPLGERQRFEAEAIEGDVPGSSVDGGARGFYTNGVAEVEVVLAEGGSHALRARAWGQQAGPDPCRMVLRVDGADVATIDVPNPAAEPGVFEVAVELAAGRHRLAAAFVNDYYAPEATDPAQRDRNFALDWIEVQGPRLAPDRALPAGHRRIIVATPTDDSEAAWRAAAVQVVGPLASRCWRRPVAAGEVDRLAALACSVRSAGGTFERGVQLALQAMLASPKFLFRVELDKAEGEALDDWELASRLSYFVWASMPDDELFALASAGRLHEPDVLRAQMRRMLADAKAVALTESFAMQWLQLRRLDDATPDPARFPRFDAALREDLATETKLFFADMVKSDRPVTEFLTADYTYLNERLARHYGVPDVRGPHFRRVTLKGQAARQRGGILTHGSILTVTSNPTRTSPVKRGKFVLETILGAPPPDPPPGVPALADDGGGPLEGTLRQRMEQHREDPNCAVCHVEMDAIGFGFENYDAVGAWRERDGELAVDPSGELPGGRTFATGQELRAILASEREAFLRALATKLLTYALGRGTEYNDRETIRGLAEATAAGGYRFSALAEAIATSEAFCCRRPERETP